MLDLVTIKGTNILIVAERSAYGYNIRAVADGRESIREVARPVSAASAQLAAERCINDIHGERAVYRATAGLGTRAVRLRVTEAVIKRAARNAAAQLIVADALSF